MIKGRSKWVKNLTALVLSGILTMSFSNIAFAREMSLQESITEALNNNRSIKEKEAAVEEAKGALGEAQGNRGITLTWEGTANKVGGHYYNDLNIDHSYGNTISASLPVYSGGKLENNAKSAKIGVEISQFNLEDERQSIILQTIEDYYDILNYKNTKKTYEVGITQYTEHLNVAKAKYDAGVVAKSDLLSAEVDLANEQQSLVTADNNLQSAMTDFNKLIGQDLMTDVDPSDDYLTDTNFDKTMQECMDVAIENRPDGIAAKKQVEQDEAKVLAAKAGNMPQVSIVAQKDISGNNMLNNDQSDKSSVGLQADWTIFDNNVTHSQVKQAEATLIGDKQSLADTYDQIRADVRKAYLSMEAARKNIQTTKVAVAQAEENNRIEGVKYQAGVGTNSDRLDAISDYVSAQMNYNEALYTYTTSKAKLYEAMGISSQLITIAQDVATAGTAADAGEKENNSPELNVLDRAAQAAN